MAAPEQNMGPLESGYQPYIKAALEEIHRRRVEVARKLHDGANQLLSTGPFDLIDTGVLFEATETLETIPTIGLIISRYENRILDLQDEIQKEFERLGIKIPLGEEETRAPQEREHKAGVRVKEPAAETAIEESSYPSEPGDPYHLFTDPSKRAIAFAQEAALRFRQNYVGPEHLLIGIVRQDTGLAAKALVSLGVEPDKVRRDAESCISRGDRALSGEFGLGPRAKSAVEFAVDEKRQFYGPWEEKHNVNTGFLLIGLLREGNNRATDVLKINNVTLEIARAAVYKLMGRPTSPTD